MSGFCKVDADLISAAGFKSDLKSGDGRGACRFRESGQKFPVSDGNFALVCIPGGVAAEIFASG